MVFKFVWLLSIGRYFKFNILYLTSEIIYFYLKSMIEINNHQNTFDIIPVLNLHRFFWRMDEDTKASFQLLLIVWTYFQLYEFISSIDQEISFL